MGDNPAARLDNNRSKHAATTARAVVLARR